MCNTENQLIIAISREFGSGGKEIAEYLGEWYEIPVYEKNILKNIGLTMSDDVESYYHRDESPRWLVNTRTIRGLTSSNEEVLAAMEFEFLREEAEKGNSFIVLGHCAEEVLAANPNLITFFISASEDFKVQRIMAEHGLDEQEARRMMKRHNRKRKSYHNYYCNHNWGDSRFYEMCLRSDKLGTRRTALLLQNYIEQRRSRQEALQQENSADPQ